MNIEQIRSHAPQIRQIARKHGIANIYVFGSVARSESGPLSDVDFLVEMEPGASLFGAAGFCYDVEQVLGVPVDVVPLSVLPNIEDQVFAGRVQKDAVPL
jgi:uncharacterized protein